MRHSLADRSVVAVKPLPTGGGGGAKGPAHQDCGFDQLGYFPRRKRGNMPTSQVKPFDIPKQQVWEAYRRVAANKGAPGVDRETLDEFESDLKNNLFKIWNRMSSGSYFPPPVRAVEIPKPHGGGVRLLGVPTIADRVAQTVVAMHLGERAEPRFHPDSYGYRPKKAAWDAVEVCRQRCWKKDWVIDLDVQDHPVTPANRRRDLVELRVAHRAGPVAFERSLEGAVGPDARHSVNSGSHLVSLEMLKLRRSVRTGPLSGMIRIGAPHDLDKLRVTGTHDDLAQHCVGAMFNVVSRRQEHQSSCLTRFAEPT